mgnify:FL=1
MFRVDPSTPLLSLNGAPLRRVAVEWRDALRTVAAISQQAPGATTAQVVEHAAKMIEGAEGSGMRLADAVIDALLSGKVEETGLAKMKRWELALKFRASAPVDLTADDVTFVDACLAQTFKVGVYGPARDALNGVTR